MMNIGKEANKWVGKYEWHVAGTITYRRGTTEKQAERIMRNFWGRANKAIYGNAWRRFNKRIENITVFDTDAFGENPHYHIVIALPRDRFDDVKEFCKHLREIWRKSCGNNFICEFEAIDDSEAWIGYITDKLGKHDCDNLHTHSSHIAEARSQTD